MTTFCSMILAYRALFCRLRIARSGARVGARWWGSGAICVSLLLILSVPMGCTGERSVPVYELTGPTMGTSYRIKLADSVASSDQWEIAQAITQELERIEALMSTWRPDSEISAFNSSAGTDWFPISDETYAVLSTAQEISKRTAGAFDVTVGPLVNLWGFGPQSIREQPPGHEEIARARERTGYEQLSLRPTPHAVRKKHPQLYVDLSAIAKGYAVDRLALLLESRNISNYLVEIGGELRARGYNARGEIWTVAVEKPLASQRSIQRLLFLQDQAVATSGNYRNFFEHAGQRYAHTIDPRSGLPVTHELASVTVVGESAMQADALATGLAVLGPEAGFDLAVKQKVAALFIVQTIDGLEEHSTPDFSTLLAAAP